ncbi:hypothetical protein OSC52_15205 [Clostridium pasteurianum]|uniref:hypothetical protein n=1 Tax=Clostridium pasteurianum TaxID=1501 RepID=UPI002260990B|nr:hypothetical protein [Clostridium pasteurianum]UZW13184.1 hypothetical protein OSC52_15205 [Clostridium pasteurianum]
MSTTDQNLNFTYVKDDNSNPGAINLRANGSFNAKEKIVINIPGRFQRISIYKNELIVSEEILPGEHIFRFNKPYKEVEPGVLFFE